MKSQLKSKNSLNSSWLAGSGLMRMRILTCFQLFPERNLATPGIFVLSFLPQTALLYAMGSMPSLVLAEMEFEVPLGSEGITPRL